VPELVAESFSPWSEKARWALDHHRIRYRYREYVPVIDEPWLRWRLGAFIGRVSTPTLITDDASHRDSYAIAEYAERHGSGPPLFPGACASGIAAWNACSEAALAAGRVHVVARMAEVPGATVETLPPGVPTVLHPVLGAAAGATFAYLRWKYGFGTDVAASDRTLRIALEDLRAALAGRDYLFDELTYADVAMAVVLQMVRPVADAYIRLGPAVRAVWTNERLAADFADLVEWRDRLYAEHRGAPATQMS
jgi:glutathione S-transferase